MRWKVPIIIASAVVVCGAGLLVGRVTAPRDATTIAQPPKPVAGLLNVWLVGPPGQAVMFCPHAELMIGPATCQPLSRVAPYVPRVLPPQPTKVAPGCGAVNRLIFRFADRSRAVYGICEMPRQLVPLYKAAWKVMTSSSPLSN
jgi:hypothetical protein